MAKAAKPVYGVIAGRRITIWGGTCCLVCGYSDVAVDVRQSIIYIDCPRCDNVTKYCCDLEESYARAAEYNRRKREE